MDARSLMRHFTIHTRMLSAVAIVTLALLTLGGVGIVAQLYARSANSSFVEQDFAAMTQIAELRHAMAALLAHQKDMSIAYQKPDEVEKSYQEWLKTLEHIQTVAARLQGALRDDAQRATVTEAMAQLDKFRQAFLPVAKTLQEQGFDSARASTIFMKRAQKNYDTAQATIEALAVELKRMADEGGARLADMSDMAVWLLAAAVIVELVVIVPLTLLNMRSICEPIREAERLAQSIAQGDLAERRIDTSGSDEAARLLTALAGMQAALRGMVSQVRASTDSISTASVEIATGNQNLSARTEQTASNLQQAASSMEQLTGTVKQSADSARQADQLACSATEVAARGGKVVSEVVSTMDDIHASSKKIADIIGVIDGIAFQTNILALNAAVEAARAGEQGRGFAVVAGEVRGLAQRSASAAREIKGLISASVDKVESGSKLVADAGRTMQEIVSSVQRVTDIIGEISSAAAEQSDGLGRVNGSVAELDRMTQQNAALVEQSAAAAESLKDQAAQLARAVGGFHLGDTPAIGRPEPALAAAAARMPAAALAQKRHIAPTPVRTMAASVVAASAIASAAASAAAAAPARKKLAPAGAAKPLPAKAVKTDAVKPEPPKAASANDDDWETF